MKYLVLVPVSPPPQLTFHRNNRNSYINFEKEATGIKFSLNWCQSIYFDQSLLVIEHNSCIMRFHDGYHVCYYALLFWWFFIKFSLLLLSTNATLLFWLEKVTNTAYWTVSSVVFNMFAKITPRVNFFTFRRDIITKLE